jgi:hypothetical protein
MHIELETVGTSRHPDVERRNRIFRTEIAAATVREDLRSIAEERHAAQC